MGIAFVAFIARTAQADTLYLLNGDRLSGTVQGTTEGKLSILTEYAGQLCVDLDSIQAVATDTPVSVHLQDGTALSGRLAQENGTQVLVAGESVHALALSNVAAIAREPESCAEPTVTGEEKPVKKKWSGTVDAGASWRSGETDTLDANLALTLMREWQRDTLTLELSAGYGEVDSQVNTRRLQGNAKWQHDLKKRLYVFGHAEAEHDPAQRLELRLTAGAGLGYKLVESERRSLALDAGLDYAREYWNGFSIKELDDARSSARDATRAGVESFARGLLRKPVPTWTANDILNGFELAVQTFTGRVEQETHFEDHVYLRLAGNYEQKLFKTSVLSEQLTFLPKLDDLGEYRLVSNLAFDSPLSEKLSLRLSLQTEYNTDTGADDDQLTSTFISGLRYSF